MKKRLIYFLDRWFGWFPLYRIAYGGYRYYQVEKAHERQADHFLHRGHQSLVSPGVEITVPGRCHLGDFSWIGSGCVIHAVGGFHFGDYSTMGAETLVLTTEHRHAGAHSVPFDSVRLVKPVHIGNHVWIGSRVSIHGGVRIGNGVIVGMGSVVTQDVPDLAIVAGNPAVVVGRRSETEYKSLVESGSLRNPRDRCEVLWVPPFSARKHGELLKRCGFEVAAGECCFTEDRVTRELCRIPTSQGLNRREA